MTTVDLGKRKVVSGKARMTVITGDPQEQNTRSAEPILPETTIIGGVSSKFTRTFPDDEDAGYRRARAGDDVAGRRALKKRSEKNFSMEEGKDNWLVYSMIFILNPCTRI